MHFVGVFRVPASSVCFWASLHPAVPAVPTHLFAECKQRLLDIVLRLSQSWGGGVLSVFLVSVCCLMVFSSFALVELLQVASYKQTRWSHICVLRSCLLWLPLPPTCLSRLLPLSLLHVLRVSSEVLHEHLL